MAAHVPSAQETARRVLHHLLERLDRTAAIDEPFAHIYVEDVFPADVYERLLRRLPSEDRYLTAAERHHAKGEGSYARAMFQITPSHLATLPFPQQELWRGIAAALTDSALKEAMYGKLATDLAFRYGVAPAAARDLRGYARPILFRETEGFEIPPHPDTRKKIVTMHLYLPANRSQLDLGTALYRRKMLAWPLGAWQNRFEKVKQFDFAPNSGYAFVVNNTLTKKSWHGRERLRPGAGVRNTLLNTFYDEARADYTGYLDLQPAVHAA